MPPTFAAIDKHTVTALRKGDASALEKVFRADYDALIHVASKQLSDPAAAPQVVENALLQVWDERAHLETPDELDKALHDAVQGYAVREQRRHAAQQGKPQAQPASAGPATPDALWAKVVAGMNAAKADAAPKHQPVDASHHHAAVHMGEVDKRSRTGAIVGAVVLIAFTAGLLWWVNRKGEETAVNRSFNSPKASIASSSAAQRSAMTLSDSTTVKLGAESKVIVPPGYGEVGTGRVVKLEGTATFVVATQSASNPFEVRAGTFAIVATGTEFSVRAYTNENIVTVRVKDGQVAIKGAAAARTLGAGSAIAIAKDGSMQEPSADALAHALAWTDGRFVVANVPLKELLPELKRWYPLDPSVADKSLLDRTATMDVSLDSTKAAIAALEKSASVKFGYEGLKTVLRDAGAPAKK